MHSHGAGGGFGGMMGGMRGLQSGGMNSPNLDNLTDEGVQGSAYDNKVVMRLATYLKSHQKDVLITIGAIVTYTVGNVTIPLFMLLGIQWGINQGYDSTPPAWLPFESWRLHLVALVFLAMSLSYFTAMYIQAIFMPKLSQSILYQLRTQMFSHLQDLSPSFFHRTPVGRIMSRSQSDVLQLTETFELMVTSVADMLSLVGIMLIMLVILPLLGLADWRLSLVCLSVVPVLFFILAYWQRFARRSFTRIRRAIAMVNGEYNQNITGVRVVESLNRQDENLEHFQDLNYEHLDANMQASRFSGGLQPIVESLIGIAFGVVIVMGGSAVLGTGDPSWGVLLAFPMWIQRFFEPIRHLTMQYTQLQRGMAAGVRIFEVIDLQPEVKDDPDAIVMPPIKGEIEFENASFHYVPGIEVLQDINLHIMPGENVALVGSTGAGKSTLVTLIHRFADLTQGTIKVDGHDIRHVKRSTLVNQMSMVLQEPYLFSGTINENIRYLHVEASDEDVIAAAQAVGAHDFIMALEGGYNSTLAERGSNLSIGQRQLLSFARAVVADPRIIILDEATANIDTYTELLIQRALQRVLQGRTSIVIAHRLSTIRNADKIIVLDHGKVAEIGNHDELLERKGVYARLYAINYGLDSDGTEGSDSGTVAVPAPAPGDNN
ncbi:MAG: ABC transporter ATP-binding protein/permease [Dehalococcoidia bacterium]|nr:ABC transporter ATP-binding protein/permease [Dehalococcoidia bacterium]